MDKFATADAGHGLRLTAPDLIGRHFIFERVDGSLICRHLQLAEHGRISGHSHPNEASWSLTEGVLSFHHDNGSATTIFSDVSSSGRLLKFAGTFVPSGQATRLHILQEVEIKPRDVRLLHARPGGTAGTSVRKKSDRSLSKDELAGAVFSYEDPFGRVIAPEVYFLPDGRVFGTSRNGERTWRIVDGQLSLINRGGLETLRLQPAETASGEFCFISPADGEFGGGSFFLKLLRRRLSRPGLPLANIIAAVKPAIILVRTHLMNEKVQDLVDMLNRTSVNYDVGLVVDETNGRPDISHDIVVWHSVEACKHLGLPCVADRPLWWCGDFPLYFAYDQLPQYQYIFMIEYDVHLTANDGRLFQNLVARLYSAQPPIDAIGLRFRAEGPSKLTEAAHLRYPNQVYGFFFPFVGLSRAAIAHLYEMRRGEAAAGTPDHEIMYCEAFVPTLLRSAGFQVSDLNALVPGAYDERLMIIPGPFVGLPLGLADGFDGHSEMIHPVYGTREFLTRLLSRFSHKGWYHHVNDMLEDAELECLPPEMLDEFRQRTHDLLTA